MASFLRTIGIRTRRDLLDELDEARDSVMRLASENFHLRRSYEATVKSLDACKELVAAYERQKEATNNFLAVLQGEQIASTDEAS